MSPEQQIAIYPRVQDRETKDLNTFDPEVLHTNKFRERVLLSQQ